MYIRVGYEPTVSLLIQNGANINEVYDGETALHVAAAAGNSISKCGNWFHYTLTESRNRH